MSRSAAAASPPDPASESPAVRSAVRRCRPVAAALGVVMPSLLIILIVARFLQELSRYAWVKAAFAGIRAGVCALILNAVVKLWKKAVVDKASLCIFLLVFGAMVLSKYALGLSLSPVIFVILAALAGIVLKVWGVKKA